MRILPRFNPLVVAPLLLAGCNSPADANPPPPPTGDEPSIQWLQANAVPFTTTVPGGSTDDLARLGQMVGDARIVGLGEGTHGSREFFDMKHRVVQYLVREKGFRAFGIEATWAEATRINRYVHTGEGDPAVLLSNLYFWTWNTQEVLDMIRWMREYNQGVPADQRVSFYGFDVQYSRVAMSDVEAYLAGVDPIAADSAREYYSCYRRFQDRIGVAQPNYVSAPDTLRTRCRQGVRAVHGLLDRAAAAYAPRSGQPAYETALRTARVVVQNEDLRSSPAATGSATRDRYMAENAAWLAEEAHPGAGVVLWAHNAHVARAEPWMGKRLADHLGDAYRVVGFTFYQGGLNAVRDGGGLRAHTAPPAAGSSYEAQFNRLGHARFYVDLRPLRTGTAPASAQWLGGPLGMRMVGAVYDPDRPNVYYADHWLPEEYDVMIHLTDVTPTRLLPFVYQ